MNKKKKVIIVIATAVCVLSAGIIIFLGYHVIHFLRLFGWFYDGDIDLEGVGIAGYFFIIIMITTMRCLMRMIWSIIMS